MQSVRAGSLLSSPSGCSYLFLSVLCQVTIRDLAQSVHHVLLDILQQSGTLRTAAIAALQTADQVKKAISHFC